jgi:hypothetical protein
MLRSIFAFTVLLAVTTAHAGQTITVQAANSGNNQILSVMFAPPGGSTSVLNTDEASLYSLTSLVFVQNLNTFAIDLFATDNQKGKVLDYIGDFSTGAFFCNPPTNTISPPCRTGTVVTAAASIVYPTGLSTDNAGDLFVLNDAPGKSPQAQVWVLQPKTGGGFQNAALIDKTFLKNQGAVDSLVVGLPLGNNVQTGDLLVVTTNPATVLQYHIADLNNPLTQSKVLIPQCATPSSQNCIPAGTLPGGIAVWPQDGSVFSNSVLITNMGVPPPAMSPGSILSFSITGNSVITRNHDFQAGLSPRLFTIRTGLQNGGALAFVTMSGPGNHGSVLELGPCANFPGDAACTPNADGIGVVATVTSGLAAPQGIAVTNSVQTATANCAFVKGGCDNFGGHVLKHTVIPDGPGNLNSNVVESLCVVPQDPRVAIAACPGSPLLVNQVCPGFLSTPDLGMTIPGNFCGASGTTGSGFALIKSLTAYPIAHGSTSQFNQTYVDADQNTDTLFPNALNPLCNNNGGTAVLLWAPLTGEGHIVEGNQLADITDGCDTRGGGPTISIFGVGFALALTGDNPLIGFAATKYANLLATIQQLNASGNIKNPVALQLTNTINNPPTTAPGCVDLSLQAFNSGNYQDAADLLTNADTSGATTCDSIVTTGANANPSAFPESPDATPPVYNPSGHVRWRLANLYHTIETRILSLPPASTWTPPVSLSVSPQGIFAECVVDQGCPTVQNPTTAKLSWALASGVNANSCSWSSTDANFNSNPPSVATGSATNPPGPFTGQYSTNSYYPGNTYTYTLTCNVPAGTASTQVAVFPPAPSGSYTTGTLTANWTNPSGAYPVTLSTGQMMSGPCTFMNGSATFTCPSTVITGTPSVTLDVSFPTMSVSTNLTVWPAIAGQQPLSPLTTNPSTVPAGSSTQVTWTLPAGATQCTLTSNANPVGGGPFTAGTTSVNGPVNSATQYQATYTSTATDLSPPNNGIIIFTAMCSAGASPGAGQVTVTTPPPL